MALEGMFHQLRDQLDELERLCAKDVLTIDPRIVDEARSNILELNSFLLCRFFSVADRCCPFEIHFGRGQYRHRENFYIGLGAEFANYEEFSDTSSALGLAVGIGLFLKSRVRCEEYVTAKGVAKARYYASLLYGDDPVRLEFGGSWFTRGKRRLIEYEPWIQ